MCYCCCCCRCCIQWILICVWMSFLLVCIWMHSGMFAKRAQTQANAHRRRGKNNTGRYKPIWACYIIWMSFFSSFRKICMITLCFIEGVCWYPIYHHKLSLSEKKSVQNYIIKWNFPKSPFAPIKWSEKNREPNNRNIQEKGTYWQFKCFSLMSIIFEYADSYSHCEVSFVIRMIMTRKCWCHGFYDNIYYDKIYVFCGVCCTAQLPCIWCQCACVSGYKSVPI